MNTATSIVTIIASVLTIIVGIWRFESRKNRYKRDQAEKAKAELDHANETGNPSDFLDAFGRMR